MGKSPSPLGAGGCLKKAKRSFGKFLMGLLGGGQFSPTEKERLLRERLRGEPLFACKALSSFWQGGGSRSTFLGLVWRVAKICFLSFLLVAWRGAEC